MINDKNASVPNKDLVRSVEKGKLRVTISDSEINLLHSIPKKIEPIIKQVCLDYNFPIKDIIPVGSSQRKTFLPGSRDIDIFVRFDTFDRSYLEIFAEKIIPDIAKRLKTTYLIKYAENPFGIIHYKINNGKNKIDIDLVATFWMESEIKLPDVLKISGMARTPFHTFYLNKNIKGLEEEVRLFKYWAKKKKIYRQNGFTGFIIELLTIIYESFLSILQNANSISELTFDFKNREKIELRKLFPNIPIIIIDPIDKNRNAAGGIHGILGYLHMKRFVKLAKNSLEDPKTLWNEYNLSGNVYSIKIEFKISLTIKNDDEYYSRLGKVLAKIFRTLKENDIELIDAIINVSQSRINFSTNTKGGKKLIKKGPPITFKENSEEFKLNNKNVWIDKGHYWTDHIQKSVEEIVDVIVSKNSIIEKFVITSNSF